MKGYVNLIIIQCIAVVQASLPSLAPDIYGSWQSTISSGSSSIISALVGQGLTENRMAASRGRVTFIRVFAPVGMIGFFAVIKIHLASILPNRTAATINLNPERYASASRLGSVKNMNRGGLKWDQDLRRTECRTKAELIIKVDSKYQLNKEPKVSHISRSRTVEMISEKAILADNYARLQSLLIVTFLQACVAFAAAYLSEFATQRNNSFAFVLAGSLILCELFVGIIEWLYTVKIANSKMIGSFDRSHRLGVIAHLTDFPSTDVASGIRIFEQLEKEPIDGGARKYQLKRFIQIEGSRTECEWYISGNYTFWGLLQKKPLFLVVTLTAAFGLLAETLAYIIYITESFNDIQAAAKWLSVQVGLFLLKLASPLFDKWVGIGSLPSKYMDSPLAHAPPNARGTVGREEWARLMTTGAVRAFDKNSILLVAIETRQSLPAAPLLAVVINSGSPRPEVVLPRIWICSANNATKAILGQVRLSSFQLTDCNLFLRIEGTLYIYKLTMEMTHRMHVRIVVSQDDKWFLVAWVDGHVSVITTQVQVAYKIVLHRTWVNTDQIIDSHEQCLLDCEDLGSAINLPKNWEKLCGTPFHEKLVGQEFSSQAKTSRIENPHLDVKVTDHTLSKVINLSGWMGVANYVVGQGVDPQTQDVSMPPDRS